MGQGGAARTHACLLTYLQPLANSKVDWLTGRAQWDELYSEGAF